MRLLDTTTLEVANFLGGGIPPYAILSHTWGAEHDEPTLQQLQDLTAAVRNDPSAWTLHPVAQKKGYAKLRAACSLALSNNYRHIWIDTVCIDKTSSAELSEAINSMYRFYQRAAVCYVYLEDVDVGPGIENPDISRCRWFTRGWTLQELVAPQDVRFYDYKWAYVGSKRDDRAGFRDQLARTTRVDAQVLGGAIRVDEKSVACRMSWAASRRTTRTEDIAYCLMGLFGVNMPLLYGEGDRAFVRLQEEILRSVEDHSIFAWTYPLDYTLSRLPSGLLATSPMRFHDTGDVEPRLPDRSRKSAPSNITNAGLHVQLHLRRSYTHLDHDLPGLWRPRGWHSPSDSDDENSTHYIAVLDCATVKQGKQQYRYGIDMVALGGGQFARTHSDRLRLLEYSDNDDNDQSIAACLRYVYVKQNPRWIVPEVKVEDDGVGGEHFDGKSTLLVDAYPSSRWDSDSRTLSAGHAYFLNPFGAFRYRIDLAPGRFDYFDVFLCVYQVEGQLGNWLGDVHIASVPPGKSLKDQFELLQTIYLKNPHFLGDPCFLGVLKMTPATKLMTLEWARNTNHLSFILQWARSHGSDGLRPELDSKEIFGSGRIVTTERLLRNRAEMDELLALTRRMACEVVYDSIDITFRQSINIVRESPSKIRTAYSDGWSHNARRHLFAILGKVKACASEIQVTGEDGGKLDSFEHYFANRLVVACIMGDVAAARELVQTKLVLVPLECKTDGQSFPDDEELCSAFLAFRPIHWAALFGHTEIVRVLTQNGADRYSKTATGFTTLHLAALMGHGGLVEYLFNSWAPLELDNLYALRRGRLEETPAHLAATYDWTEWGDSLFRVFRKSALGSDDGSEYGSESSDAHSARNGLGETPLHRAAAMNNTQAITAIASAIRESAYFPGGKDYIKESLDSPDGYGRSPLWHAAATGATAAVRTLLALSVNVDKADKYGRTPLHIACREGRPEAIRLLLEAGADVNRLTTAPCLSPCHFAALAKDIDCLRLVVEYGAKADLCHMGDGLELGAIHITAANGWLDGVRFLMDQGCDPDTPCSHYVTTRGHSQADAGVNVARSEFMNATELAVRGGHRDVVDFFMTTMSARTPGTGK